MIKQLKMKKMYEMPGFVEYRSRRILEVCEYLTPVMNQIHDTSYSFRFWTTLLKTYVKTCVERENLLSEKIRKDKPLLLPLSGWSLPSSRDRWKMRLRYYGNILLKNSSLKTITTIIGENDNVCIGLRAKFLEEYGIGVYCPSYSPICINFLGRRKRKKAYQIAKNGETVFLKNVIRQLPKYYIECFDQLVGKIKLINPADKTFHAEHIPEFMEMLVALYVEHGAKYYRYQYGGFIGEAAQSVTPEKYVDIDKHLTYGWKIHEKDEPSKAFRLEDFKRRYDALDIAEKQDVAIIYDQITNDSIKHHYTKVSQNFFKEIDRNKFSNILLRPRGFTRKLNNSGTLSFLDLPEGVTVDKGKKHMAEIVKSTKIVVQLNHPSTNFLECVYVNHPIVSILSSRKPTEIVLPYYSFFLDEGVMHPNMKSLIAHLNSVDIDSWWAGVVKKPMYQAFKDKFAKKV